MKTSWTKRIIAATTWATLACVMAQEAPPIPPAAPAPDAASDNPLNSRRAVLQNPAAWSIPSTHIALVNIDNSVDADWLESVAQSIEKYVRIPVKVVALEGKPSNPWEAAQSVRTQLSDDAKLFVVLARFSPEVGAPPVLSAPQNGWAVMDVAWMEQGGGDKPERLAKQVWRTLGFSIGCGLQSRPQAVMFPATKPEEIDEALSNNFHPQNLAVLDMMSQKLGLERIQLKSREELEAMGLLPLRVETSPEGGKQ